MDASFSVVKASLAQLKQDCLADVFRLWDCFEQGWITEHVFLFRFESDNLLIWEEEETFQALKGPVSTTEVFVPRGLQIESFDSQSCLCWRFDDSWNEKIGSMITVSDLLSCFE